MAEVLFDTQKMVDRLEAAGIPPDQARLHTALLAEVIGAADTRMGERCCSKPEHAQDMIEVRARFDRLEMRIDASAAQVKGELIRWVVTVGILQTALIAGLVLKILP